MEKNLINYRSFDNLLEDLFGCFIDKDIFDNTFDVKSLVETDNHYELKYPNIPEKLDKLNVTVEDNIINVEYSYKDKNSSQTFSASRTLPEDCDYDKISANVEDNVLVISIPKIVKN